MNIYKILRNEILQCVKCLNSNISKYTDEHPELNRELDPWSCTYTFNVQKYKP